jgi:hypothetical protein
MVEKSKKPIFEDKEVQEEELLEPSRVLQVVPKRRYGITSLRYVTSQKSADLILFIPLWLQF